MGKKKRQHHQQPAPRPTTPTPMRWQNKIVGNDLVPPAELVAHDLNFRSHPTAQTDALSAAIENVGYIRSVTVSKRTMRILDGHCRVKLALQNGEPTIPVEYVDLTEQEEKLALATLDPLAALAETDAGKLEDLLRQVQTSDQTIADMLTGLAEEAGIVPAVGDEGQGEGGKGGEGQGDGDGTSPGNGDAATEGGAAAAGTCGAITCPACGHEFTREPAGEDPGADEEE